MPDDEEEAETEEATPHVEQAASAGSTDPARQWE
jgi:hypothetical protein